MFGGSFGTFASKALESQNTDSHGCCPVRKSKLGFILMKVVQQKLDWKFSSSTEVFRLNHFVTSNQKLQEDIHDRRLKISAEKESIKFLALSDR